MVSSRQGDYDSKILPEMAAWPLQLRFCAERYDFAGLVRERGTQFRHAFDRTPR
jgi:hypothetical protein